MTSNLSFEGRVKRLEEMSSGLGVTIRRALVRESVLVREGMTGHSKMERVWSVAVGGLVIGYGRSVADAFNAVEAKLNQVNLTMASAEARRNGNG